MKQQNYQRMHSGVRRALLATLICWTGGSGLAQTFLSKSTGVDGDLLITAPGVTQFALLPVGGGNIYNFQTITINADSTLSISGQTVPWPIFFLATNAVTVAGTIDLSGQAGPYFGGDASLRMPGLPGPGGYSGGLGSFGSSPALPGNGPGGGQFFSCGPVFGGGGTVTSNGFAVPLVGGSGGGGAGGASGGGGGGALLIASSASITLTGAINANGGAALGPYAGGGAGGTVRLAAPSISGNGQIDTTGGGPYASCVSGTTEGANGIVRLESYQNTFNGSVSGALYDATPVNTFVPTAQPLITVTTIGGFAVNAMPTGSFTVPDAVVNAAGPLTIQMTAQNIPVGTVPSLFFFSENVSDTTVLGTPLAGTTASSTSTATFTFSPGYSRGYVSANWTGLPPQAPATKAKTQAAHH